MHWVRFALMGLAIAFLSAGLSGADEKKTEKPKDKKTEKKSGTVTGAVTAKEKNWIEVKADGEEKARRYMPKWIGGNTGGLDKDILKQFAELKVGSRVRIEWEFDERARAVKVELLKDAPKKDN